MPITIEYQPNLAVAGQLAYQAGRGQYLQAADQFGFQQQQLGEQARQFDQRQAFMGAVESNRNRQFELELLQRGNIASAELGLRQQNIAAQLAQQQMVQQGYAYSAQMEYKTAVMREQARLAEQQMVMDQQRAMAEQESLNRFKAENKSVLSPEQSAALDAQFFDRWGYDPGYPAHLAIEAQKAVEETAMAKRAAVVSEETGLSPESVKTMLSWDERTQSYDLNEFGKGMLAWRAKKDESNRQATADWQQNFYQMEQIRLKELEIEKAYELDQRQRQEKEQQATDKQASQMQESAMKAYTDSTKAMAAYTAAKKKALKDYQESGDDSVPFEPVDAYSFDWPVASNQTEFSNMPSGTIFWARNSQGVPTLYYRQIDANGQTKTVIVNRYAEPQAK